MLNEFFGREVRTAKINIVRIAVFCIVAIVASKQCDFNITRPLLLIDILCISSLTALIYSLLSPYAWDKVNQRFHIALKSLIVFLICAVATTIVTTISSIFSVQLGFCPSILHGIREYALFFISVHSVPMIVVGYMISSWRQSEEKLESAIASLLSTQVDNHTLYNGINHGMALAHKENAPETMDLFSNMVGYFRRVTKLSSDGVIYLDEERQLMEHYINFRCFSFRDLLHVEWQWDSSLDAFELPPMILQPLVENAIKHGVGLTKGGTLRIILERTAEGIRIATENAVAPDSLKSKMFYKKTGVGIENLKARLRLSFGRDAKYNFAIKDGWATAEILISKRVLDFETGDCQCKIFPLMMLEN